MIQWFRGELEASYVGTPNGQPYFGTHSAATHYKLHVYRAALKNLVRIEPPSADAAQASSASATLYQARVDDALIAGARGPGTTYQGPVFELRVETPHFSHSVQKDGRSYGRLTGVAQLYCDLPGEPAQPAVETALVTEEAAVAQTDTPEPLRAELRQTTAAAAAAPSAVSEGAEQSAQAQADKGSAPGEAKTHVPPARIESAAPLFALAAAVALGLWVSCGAPPALLWCLFMLPTLVARRLFQGIFHDSSYIRGFGALLAIVQLLCASSLVSEWWSEPCKQLHALPLIGIVAVIFPAGLLPSVLPLTFNAAGLALVLSVWCGGNTRECRNTGVRPSVFPASVEHPGVPRTNEDGSWPRRPPGR